MKYCINVYLVQAIRLCYSNPFALLAMCVASAMITTTFFFLS